MSNRAQRNVRFDERRGPSSRASTAGGSSSGSTYTEYSDSRYNIAALEEALQATNNELDLWKTKAIETDRQLRKLREEDKARIKGLENENENLKTAVKTLTTELKAVVKDGRDLEEKNSKLKKKLEKSETKSTPSSPEGGSKPARRLSVSDKHNDKLRERFNRSSESNASGGSSTSKPPSSSQATRGSSGRRLSVSNPYIEGYGPPAPMPTSPVAHRPKSYVHTTFPVTTSTIQSPLVSAMPRSAISTHRPSVEYTTYLDDGNYHPHPLGHEPLYR